MVVARQPPRGQRIVHCVNRGRPGNAQRTWIQLSLACTGKGPSTASCGATCQAREREGDWKRGKRELLENVFVLCHQTNVATLTQLPRWGHDNFRSFWLRCSSCAPAIVHGTCPAPFRSALSLYATSRLRSRLQLLLLHVVAPTVAPDICRESMLQGGIVYAKRLPKLATCNNLCRLGWGFFS